MKVKNHISDNIRKGWTCYPLKDTIGPFPNDKVADFKLNYIYHRLFRDFIVDEENDLLFVKRRRK
jgi:hypothetical protein